MIQGRLTVSRFHTYISLCIRCESDDAEDCFCFDFVVIIMNNVFFVVVVVVRLRTSTPIVSKS